jgi:hypothetical protein
MKLREKEPIVHVATVRIAIVGVANVSYTRLSVYRINFWWVCLQAAKFCDFELRGICNYIF